MGSNLFLSIGPEVIRDGHVFFESIREKKSMAVPSPFVMNPKKILFHMKNIKYRH